MTDADDLYDLIRLVRPLYKALEGTVIRELEGTGLTVTERAVLEQVHDNGPMPVPRIGHALIVPRQFVQKTVDGLTRKGLIERRRNKAHRRSALMALTPLGAELIDDVLAREAKVTAIVAASLAPGDVATARAVIETMIEGYGQEETSDG